MKELLSIFTLLVTITCSAQSNLDFENWSINYSGVDAAKNWVNTSDATKYDAPATLFKEVENPAVGLASIKLSTAYWEEGSDYGLDTLVGSLVQQANYTKKPKSFEFLYKSNPQEGDAILVGVQLTTNLNDSIIVVGEGFFTSNKQQESWETQKVNIEYYSEQAPTNINIIVVSSANAVLGNGESGYAKIGSTLQLDNLVLNVSETLAKENYYTHVFPNPAKAFINVETNSPENQKIEIYDLTGKLLLTSFFSHQSQINISKFISGAYIYKVYNSVSGNLTASNQFIIAR